MSELQEQEQSKPRIELMLAIIMKKCSQSFVQMHKTNTMSPWFMFNENLSIFIDVIHMILEMIDLHTRHWDMLDTRMQDNRQRLIQTLVKKMNEQYPVVETHMQLNKTSKELDKITGNGGIAGVNWGPYGPPKFTLEQDKLIPTFLTLYDEVIGTYEPPSTYVLK